MSNNNKVLKKHTTVASSQDTGKMENCRHRKYYLYFFFALSMKQCAKKNTCITDFHIFSHHLLDRRCPQTFAPSSSLYIIFMFLIKIYILLLQFQPNAGTKNIHCPSFCVAFVLCTETWLFRIRCREWWPLGFISYASLLKIGNIFKWIVAGNRWKHFYEWWLHNFDYFLTVKSNFQNGWIRTSGHVL